MGEKFNIVITCNDKKYDGTIATDTAIYNSIFGYLCKIKKRSDIYTLLLNHASVSEPVTEIELIIPTPSELYGDELYFYHDANDTNAQTKMLKHCENIGHRSGQVVVYKNKENGMTFGIGLIESLRFRTLIKQCKNAVSIVMEMENKPLVPNEKYVFDRFIISNPGETTEHFLDRYAKLVAKVNNVHLPKTVPVGFCSWSRYYGNIDKKKITDEIQYTKHYFRDKNPSVIQLDDGWQVFGTFAGKYEVDKKKFPDGLEPLIKQAQAKKMRFGLWLAPFVINKNSPYFEELKDIVDLSHNVSSLGEDIYSFDFDNPTYYEFLKKQFTYYRSLGVTYYKLDFLVHTFWHSNFKSDYKIALYRKGIQTIREAVGDDALLVGCGGYVLPQIGIFPINRITCDIIWGTNPEFPPFYQIVKDVSKTISYRYFYNGVVQVNDPDGVVVRNYDVGDGFNATFDEAKLIATMIASSGGSVLHNEELNNLPLDRLSLIQRLTPPLRISTKPVDYFEDDAPTAVSIDRLTAKNPYVYVACYSYGDKSEKTIRTSDFGLDKAIVIRVWDNKVLGVLSEFTETIGKHAAEIYLLVPVPEKPSFLYSDINVTGGRELFHLKQTDTGYTLCAKKPAFNKYNRYCFIPNGYTLFGQKENALDEGVIVKVD